MSNKPTYEELELKIQEFDQDVIEREQTEEKLIESLNHYRTLFERSSDAIFIVDVQTGKYIDANKAAEKLTGLSIAEIRQKTTKDITPEGAEQRLEDLQSFKDSKEFGEVKYTIRKIKIIFIAMETVKFIHIYRIM